MGIKTREKTVKYYYFDAFNRHVFDIFVKGIWIKCMYHTDDNYVSCKVDLAFNTKINIDDVKIEEDKDNNKKEEKEENNSVDILYDLIIKSIITNNLNKKSN